MKKRKKSRISLLSFAQMLFISASHIQQNDLDTLASACAFGFLFSFLPLVLMVISILTRVLRASSETLRDLAYAFPFFERIFNLGQILDTVDFSAAFTALQVFLGLWIFWMARSIFVYIQKGMTHIFHTERPERALINQILILAGEIILVLGAAALVLASTSLQTLQNLPSFMAWENSPRRAFFSSVVKSANVIPYLLSFAAILLIFKFYTRTNPPLKLCLSATIMCNGIFGVVVFALNSFLNFERFNLIYGFLGNLVVLLIEVKIFFWLFFAFAQMIFVIQSFDELLLAELYLLPSHDETDIMSALRRALFIQPDFLINSFHSLEEFKTGEAIMRRNSYDDTAYYVVSGTVRRYSRNNITYLERGSVFGEAACLLGTRQKSEYFANTDCRLLAIEGKTFRRLMKLNGNAAKKAMHKFSLYINRVEEP